MLTATCFAIFLHVVLTRCHSTSSTRTTICDCKNIGDLHCGTYATEPQGFQFSEHNSLDNGCQTGQRIVLTALRPLEGPTENMDYGHARWWEFEFAGGFLPSGLVLPTEFTGTSAQGLLRLKCLNKVGAVKGGPLQAVLFAVQATSCTCIKILCARACVIGLLRVGWRVQ